MTACDIDSSDLLDRHQGLLILLAAYEAMNRELPRAFATGYERLAAWSDLVDRINVFPVADGDTGRNLLLSLAPLRHMGHTPIHEIINSLLFCSRGTSGSITTHFLKSFLTATGRDDLSRMAVLGREQAWQAVDNPKPGTILSVFDALCEALEKHSQKDNHQWTDHIIHHLEQTVSSSSEQLAELKAAGVVDSGALGVFIFFDGFFTSLSSQDTLFRPVTEIFRGKLEINPSYKPEIDRGYCIDVMLERTETSAETERNIRMLGTSAVTMSHGDYLKAHLHTDDRELLQRKLHDLGDVIQWSSDDLGAQTSNFLESRIDQALHIVTDSAASVTREDAARLGITLLDSYVNLGQHSIPESCLAPEELYRAMRSGTRISTSQASVFERHQQYDKLLSLFPRAYYLCVGSIYTGNYQAVSSWKRTHDPDNRLLVIDTGLASGKLGLVAIATARYSARTTEPKGVINFARQALDQCTEYVCLDKLQYLAAGGRISKTSSFVGDLLHMKPIITPTPEGAKKVTALRSRKDQLAFILNKIREVPDENEPLFFLLEYTDTCPFLEDTVLPELREACPKAEFMMRPISITSGAHMGPGTWAVAFLPGIDPDLMLTESS